MGLKGLSQYMCKQTFVEDNKMVKTHEPKPEMIGTYPGFCSINHA